MNKKLISIGLSILLLATIIIGTALWIRVYFDSIKNYRSPLRQVELAPQPSISPGPTNRVVIILISGLGYDDTLALNLPVLEQLRQAGATAAIESIPPSYAQTTWATLITGAPPETNDAAPVDLPLAEIHSLETDTIFAQAQAAGLKTALLGLAAWSKLLPQGQINHSFFVNEAGPAADQAIFEAALPLIENDQADLLLFHFTQVDEAAQASGGTASEAYRQAAAQVDAYLNQISAAMDLNRSVLIVLSDHGHIAKGGHGGNEVEVIWQPLVMIGENVIPGNYSDVSQTDVAPTIATLLGLPVPTAAQGRILFELFHLTQAERATAQMALTRQRVALTEAYLSQIGGPESKLPEQLLADLDRAQGALEKNNLGGAFQLAGLAQTEADAQMAAARHKRLSTEQFRRFIGASLIALLWFVTMWHRRGFHAGLIVIAALLTVALYHTLYQIQGYSYSLSSVKPLTELPLEIARRTAVSLLVGGGLVLVVLMLVKEDNWLTLLGSGYGFGLLVTFIFALPLLWAFWQNGFVVTWHLPGVLPAFWQLTALFEVLASAILALLLPWPIMMLNLFVSLTRHYLSGTRSQKSDVLPGLHL